ncbi:hypothetical protein ACIBCD_15120 [Nocardia brasiliensis]|uniref:hypothetical protein n=1 Tax=Nocardia brasiliensis TaxID=37326 RepID=UPI00378A1BA1
MADDVQIRVEELVKQLRRSYSDSVAVCGRLAQRKHDDLDWPDWCWLPMGGVYDYVQSRNPLGITDLAKVAALTEWRLGRGIYRPEVEVVEAAIGRLYDSAGIGPGETELWHRGTLPPLEQWEGLPEWCCYVAHPYGDQQPEGPTKALGAFVHLEHDMNNGRPELRLLIDTDGSWNGLQPIPLYLDRPNLGAALADEEQSIVAALRGVNAADVRSLSRPGVTGTMQGYMAWAVLPLILTLIDPDVHFRGRDSATDQPTRAEQRDGQWRPATATRNWAVTYQKPSRLRVV